MKLLKLVLCAGLLGSSLTMITVPSDEDSKQHCDKQYQLKQVHTIRSAVAASRLLRRQKKSLPVFLRSSAIHHLFAFSQYKGFEGAQVVQAQKKVLAQLYAVLFKQVIVQTEQLLQSIVAAQKYFNQLYLNKKVPFYKKAPWNWYYSKAYKKQLLKKLKQLNELEQHSATLLGIAYHGYHNMNCVQSLQQVEHEFEEALQPVHDFFGKPHHQEIKTLFYELSQMHQDFKSYQKAMHKKLSRCKVPHHNDRYGYWYVTGLLAGLAGYGLYQKYTDQVNYYWNETKKSAEYNAVYIVEAVKGLKNTFWDDESFDSYMKGLRDWLDAIEESLSNGKVSDDEKIENFTTILDKQKTAFMKTPQTYETIHKFLKTNTSFFLTSLVTPAKEIGNSKAIKRIIGSSGSWEELSYEQRKNALMKDPFISIEALLLDIKIDCNHALTDTLERKQEIVQRVLQGIPLVREFLCGTSRQVKDQRMNMYLAALLPTILTLYGFYQFGKKIMHKNWYGPIRSLLREIDRLLTSVGNHMTPSFADDGRLYLLFRQLHQVVYAVPDDDVLVELYEDLKDLRSFDLDYEQKRQVIERMYRTYDFLKLQPRN